MCQPQYSLQAQTTRNTGPIPLKLGRVFWIWDNTQIIVAAAKGAGGRLSPVPMRLFKAFFSPDSNFEWAQFQEARIRFPK
jgi:hypothetical protein